MTLLTTKQVMERTGLKRNMVMRLVHMPGSPWFPIGQRAYVVDEQELEEQIKRIKEEKRNDIRHHYDGTGQSINGISDAIGKGQRIPEGT